MSPVRRSSRFYWPGFWKRGWLRPKPRFIVRMVVTLLAEKNQGYQKHKNLTVEEMLKVSSNIGFAKLGKAWSEISSIAICVRLGLVSGQV